MSAILHYLLLSAAATLGLFLGLGLARHKIEALSSEVLVQTLAAGRARADLMLAQNALDRARIEGHAMALAEVHEARSVAAKTAAVTRADRRKVAALVAPASHDTFGELGVDDGN